MLHVIATLYYTRRLRESAHQTGKKHSTLGNAGPAPEGIHPNPTFPI
jgi:hypothetical protein